MTSIWEKKISAEVWLIHAEQMSLYNFIILRKKTMTKMKTKQLKQDQVYFNTRVPTQVNTSQHESTRINTSPTRVNTNQHESNTSQHESARV